MGGGTDNEPYNEPYALRPSLKPAQRRVLSVLAESEGEEFTRSTYEEIAHVSRSQAAYDVSDLVKLGLVDRLGTGRATRYRVVSEGDGRRRKWTPARIREELERFCAGRGTWPRAAEFREAGCGSLYLAASRYGGIEHWASELGFHEAAPTSAGGPGSLEPERTSATGFALAVLAALFVLGLVLIIELVPTRPSGGEVLVAGVARERVDAAPSSVPARRSLQATPAGAGRVALRLTATGEGSWIAARRGSATGPLLWKGTLESGESRRLSGTAIWLRVEAPANLVASVDGDRVSLPARSRIVRVSDAGIRVLETAPRAPAPVVETEAPPSAQPVSAAAAPPAPSSSATSQPSGASSPAPDEPAPDPPPGGSSTPSPDPPPPKP
jgi:hypothetical protein